LLKGWDYGKDFSKDVGGNSWKNCGAKESEIIVCEWAGSIITKIEVSSEFGSKSGEKQIAG
jgi:hypothetical protein